MKNNQASLLDYIKSAAVYVLPHHLVSRLIFKATRIKSSYVPTAIKKFSQVFGVNLDEAVNPDPNSYATFNAFFTRPIKPTLRPIVEGKHTLASPVDGAISQIGDIQEGRVFQAKGHEYSATELLGGDKALAKPFENGKFTTIYLSPKDYHRIHIPMDGVLEQQIYIPGRLYSVAPFTVKTLKGIFARNERVATLFDTPFGKMAVVLVGALNVAAIETVWGGLITPPTGRHVSSKNYKSGDVSLKKGDELGRFNMGSTVILLFENADLQWNSTFETDSLIKMGEELAQFKTK